MQRRLNFDPTSAVDQLNSISAFDTTFLPRHRWYYFKEAFSPELVSLALRDSKFKSSDLVIDPFSGSGTVALTATTEGHSAIGIEVNPFLAFVARTKLISCRPSSVTNNLRKVIWGIQAGTNSPLENFSTFSEKGGAEKWLFNSTILQSFEGGWNETQGLYAPVRDLIRLCLIGAALDTANAVKDGKTLRYRPDWKSLNFGKSEFLRSFEKRIDEVITDLGISHIKSNTARIVSGDSRQLTSDTLNEKKFRLCVMSPPYLNSFDYSDVYRPELFLGKFVHTHTDLQKLRMNTLRSHVQVKWPDPIESDFGSLFWESFSEIKANEKFLWNKRIPAMIQAYFEDMKQILARLRELAEPDASVWIVVSTSAYAGIEVPVDLILADIGAKVGSFPREVSVIRYLGRVSGQQWDKLFERKNQKPRLRESVIILDAKPRYRK